MNKLLRRLRSQAGFSIGEALAAVLVLLIASSLLVTGIQLAGRQYMRARLASASRVLESTLTSIIQNELANTAVYRRSDGGIFSINYADEKDLVFFTAVDGEGGIAPRGEIALGYEDGYGGFTGKRLVPSAAYTGGMTAGIGVSYDEAEGAFSVTLSIYGPEGAELTDSTFSVIPLNDVRVE